MKTIEFCKRFTRSLTTGLNTGAAFTGGAGADTFYANVDSTVPANTTLTAGDSLVGGDGTDICGQLR